LLFVTSRETARPCFTVNAEEKKVLSICGLMPNSAVERAFDVEVHDSILNLELGLDATLSAIDVRSGSSSPPSESGGTPI